MKHSEAQPQTTVALCMRDNLPCYVSAGTPDAHWRCGTVQCGGVTEAKLRFMCEQLREWGGVPEDEIRRIYEAENKRFVTDGQ